MGMVAMEEDPDHEEGVEGSDRELSNKKIYRLISYV
jgi:hypothetical protein